MTDQSTTPPEIILYDLACTHNRCFSPAVWRIRLMLNYKQIPYSTVFLEFPDIEPKLKELGVESSSSKYTVPTIHHLPSNSYVMDSVAIASFLEKHYPDRPVILQSELGDQIESLGRAEVGKVVRASIAPREIHILSPRSQAYYRNKVEKTFGVPLESMLDTEEQVWKDRESGRKHVGKLLLTNKDKGPFILGANPSFTDFFVAGALEQIRMVHQETFDKLRACPGYGEIYDACYPFMEKRD